MTRGESIGPVLLATKNRHKAGELAALIDQLPGSAGALDLAEWEKANHPLPEAEEGAESFVANALAKARFYARQSGLPALADDSGLCVAALGGGPGVQSARFGGPGLTDADRVELLLNKMAACHDRRAYFISVLALARPDGRALWWSGRLDGLISREVRGEGGFGYDPVFYYPAGRRTLAQMSPEEKNSISHRALAARAFKEDALRAGRFLRAVNSN